MTGSQLLALDLVAAIVTAGSWIAAAALAARLRPWAGGPATGPDTTPTSSTMSRRGAWITIALFCMGVAGVIGQCLFTAQLAGHGWWFVQDKIVFALPLVVVAAIAGIVLAAPGLYLVIRGKRATPGARGTAALVGAAAAGVAGILARQVIGYPLELLPALVLVAGVLLVAMLSYAVFAGHRRRVVTALAASAVLLLVASVGLAWLESAAQPAALAATHEHTTPAATSPPMGAPIGTQAPVSVTTLRTPADTPGTLRAFTLTAQRQEVTLASGQGVSAWTYGSLPGPELRVNQGDLVEVTLHNTDIDAGVTIHWHGYDVPAGEDGVAGVTQDAVLPGESFTYRFVATDPGTYWYHTHQASADGVRRGLFGTLVVLPPGGVPESVDLTVPLHTLGGSVILGDSDAAETRGVAAGQRVRLRLVNTDQSPHRFRLDGAAFIVAAADGRDLNGPTPVTGRALRVPAGGRLDVVFEMPQTGARLSTDAAPRASLTLSPEGVPVSPTASALPDLDLLSYGSPSGAATPAGDGRVDATMVLDRKPRFLHGVPAYGYTVNGQVFPHIPSIQVSAGNEVNLTVVNRGWETHPMHVHGHHVLVIARNGIRSTGSPLWLDTFDVQPGEVWEVTFTADNPGIWMDHCHNLDHAAEGMMMALVYSGVTSPFQQGGEHDNRAG